ncbi:hypothetical protein HOQ56_gp22 [uncultured phage_MedDCM-OCT-S38-C3]|uniref:Internal virion protein n=1 Tax=uncultured phage_MedDCM-OCT-S38-C3 TaxID=2740803 RepID=A0A6S4PD45_9CAUD|nr:hypothetical protein HOQ56_gp22 [uncultured phage_MedDCM-OCT-S38-C3]BAQ94447.1 hypothetical protein [uncultured phage_MedDCM-OCT-S38-C3]
MVLPLLGLGAGVASAGKLGLALGVGQAALGIGQQYIGWQAKNQQYKFDKAFSEANSEFASWQAGFNARINNANKQFQYWQETVNYNQELAYANNARNVESLRAFRQAEVVRDTRAAAGASYIQDSEAIAASLQEQEMQAAIAQQQYSWRALQARSSVRALAQEGKSIDRLVNNYARQEGDYMAIEEINEGIRNRQYTRAQAGRIAQYLSQYNSQQFYDEQVIFDPVVPFPPLPTMVTPPPPNRIGAGPSKAGMFLGMAGSILDGIDTGMSFAGKIKALGTPKSSKGAGT